MNKKFLSAILFGALMVTATGTFVSCKDYDDDIDRIDTELGDLKSQVTALQTKVNEGKWITSLTSTTGGFTVAFNDGSSYTIVNGKDGDKGETGAAGQNGKDGTTVEVKDGYWYVGGEKTDYVAVTKDELGKIKVPYVGEDGSWYFYNEAGEAVKSNFKAVGATYAVNANGVYTLYVPDANGEMQTVKLPTAASKITNLSLGTNKTLSIAPATAWNLEQTGNVIKKTSDWKGTRTLPSNGDIVYCNIADSPIDLRIDPVDVDATDIKFTLTDSKNGTLSHVELVAEEYKEYVTSSSPRAAYGNGLYSLTLDNFVVAKDKVSDFATELTNAESRGYAVNANSAYRSAYQVTVKKAASTPILSSLKVKDATETTAATIGTTTGKYSNVKVGTTYTVEFDKVAALYDAYFVIADQYKNAFNITWEDAGHTFTVGKNPDVSTIDANFPIDIYTVDNTGKTQKTTITIELSTVIAPAKDYELITKDISDTKQYFSIDLAIMKNNLGANLDTWKLNVNLGNTYYKLFSELNDDGTPKTEVSNVISNIAGQLFQSYIVSAISDDYSKVAGNVNDANYIQIKIDNSKAAAAALKLNTTYYVQAIFNNNASSELNQIIVPVKFTAPALADLFAQKSGYVKDGAINAYFYKTGADKSVDMKEYFSKYVSDAVVTGSSDKVGSTNKSTLDLATVAGADFAAHTITLNTTFKKDAPKAQFELGYGETLVFNAIKDNYAGWKYDTDAAKTYTFNVKMMSSIIEGSIAPASGSSSITINANDATTGAKITSDMIKGYDYNNNAYEVVPDKYNTALPATAAWSNVYITSVSAFVDKDNYIKSVTVEPATKASNGSTVKGYFLVTAKSLSNTETVQMPVTVTDAWGYTKTDNVPVTIQKN